MIEGIRYHDESAIREFPEILGAFPINEAVDQVDLDDMNQKTAYKTDRLSLNLIKEQIQAIAKMFARAVEEDSIILGEIG